MSHQQHRWICAAFAILVSAAASPAIAQSGTIPLSELPPPPALIADLIDRGNVRFVYGWDTRPDAKLPDVGRPLDGLTVYELSYQFEHHTSMRNRRSNPHAVTRIRLGESGLRCKHTVWFREAPQIETFWSNQLVLHELDHVLISSDPRLASLFLTQVQDQPLITPIEASSYSSAVAAEVNRVAKEHVATIYRSILSLVDIRYRELDRVTNHGARPLPAELQLRLSNSQPTAPQGQ
ncbi:hypothetical protein [Rosistilla oblonga]|uniref:hypothetical protein n=1 Tax=Rosistilla oblonga TaxID=2527990 RepID=UPI003A97C139